MRLTLEQIVEETRQWPEDSVAELIDRITIARHGGLSADRDARWTDVAARRSAAIDRGDDQLVSGEEVSARIRKIVGA